MKIQESLEKLEEEVALWEVEGGIFGQDDSGLMSLMDSVMKAAIGVLGSATKEVYGKGCREGGTRARYKQPGTDKSRQLTRRRRALRRIIRTEKNDRRRAAGVGARFSAKHARPNLKLPPCAPRVSSPA